MNKTIFLAVIFCSIVAFTKAQGLEAPISGKHSCGLDHPDVLTFKGMFEFTSNSEAITVVDDIMAVVGLRPNFKVQAASVPNAAAVVNGSTRFILYNPQWIQSVNKRTKTDWAAISIVAHEIAHHLNGHTLLNSGSRPDMELEADEFSGFVLRKMGASLQESQVAMAMLASPTGSASHPARDRRLRAIEKGWRQADEAMGDYNDQDIAQEEDTRPTKESTPIQRPPKETIPDKNPIPTTTAGAPAFAKWRVNINRNPNSTYYITKSNNFILLKGHIPVRFQKEIRILILESLESLFWLIRTN